MRTLLVALVLTLVPGVAYAKDYTAEKFDSRIEVLTGGSLRITETIVLRFEEGTFTFFYRTIPTRRTDGVDFVSASMDGQMFSQGEQPGQVEVRRKEGLRVEWHFPKTQPSTHTFELTYIVKGVARAGDDEDVIAWRALPSEHGYRIESSRIEMVLPSTPTEAPTFEMRGVGSWTETHSDARVLVTATGIGKNGWFEVWTRMPRGSVIDAPPGWQQRQLQHQQSRQPAIIAATIVAFAGLVVLFGIRQNYDSPPHDIQTSRVFSGPPDTSRPAIAGALTTNGSLHLEHVMGTLFGLASRGVIDIHEQKKGAFGQRKFVIARGRHTRPLAPHEQTLLDEVFSAKGASAGEVPLDKARTHLVRHFSRLKTVVQTEMTNEGFFDAGRQQVRRRYNVVGVGFLVLSGIALIPAIALAERIGGWPFVVPTTIAVLGLTSFIFAAAHTPLSNEGVRRAEAWRAYQKQLRDVPKDLRRADWAGGPRSPGDLLPLAVALGLAAAWSKIFKDRGAQLPLLVPRGLDDRCEHRVCRLRRPWRRGGGRWRWRRRWRSWRRWLRGRVGLAGLTSRFAANSQQHSSPGLRPGLFRQERQDRHRLVSGGRHCAPSSG